MPIGSASLQALTPSASPAGTQQTEHALPEREAGHTGADGFDHARDVEPEHGR